MVAHREPGDPRRPVRDDRARRHPADGPQRAAPDQLPGVAGARLAGDRRVDPVQHPRRRDPHRPPQALPGDVHRVGQPGALGGRQPADARGDARPRRQRVHRRVHDRDGPGVRLRAAGDHAVREVRGDVLQLRVPAQLLPPAPTGARRRRQVRCRSRRSTPGWSLRSGCSTTTSSTACEPPREAGRAEFAARFAEETAADPRLGAVAPVLLYRTLGPTLPARRAGRAAALWPMAMRCAQVNPEGVARAGHGDGPDAGDRLFDAIVDSASRRGHHRRHLGRDAAAAEDQRRPRPRRHPRTARRAGGARRRGAARWRRRVAADPVGR